MLINEIQKAFRESASALGDYQALSKTQLANGFCDADEAAQRAKEANDQAQFSEYDALRSSYHSALMLRYWYKIYEWQKNSDTLNLEPEEFVDWLTDSLYVAFYYRTWRYEFEADVKEGKFIAWKLDENGDKIQNLYYYKLDENAPDKIINRCCGSMRGRAFQFHNKDKRRVNTQTYSLDAMLSDDGDYAAMNAGSYTIDDIKSRNEAYGLVNALLKRGESLEALIVESIAYYDSYKEKKIQKVGKGFDEETGEEVEYKYATYSFQYDPRKLIKHLSNLSEKYIFNFCETYSVHASIAEILVNRLKKLGSAKLYKAVEKTLAEIKQSPELLSYLTGD